MPYYDWEKHIFCNHGQIIPCIFLDVKAYNYFMQSFLNLQSFVHLTLTGKKSVEGYNKVLYLSIISL